MNQNENSKIVEKENGQTIITLEKDDAAIVFHGEPTDMTVIIPKSLEVNNQGITVSFLAWFTSQDEYEKLFERFFDEVVNYGKNKSAKAVQLSLFDEDDGA